MYSLFSGKHYFYRHANPRYMHRHDISQHRRFVFHTFAACPKCGHDRTCSINPGDKSSSCECLPGSVERDGECVWCKREYCFMLL